MKLKYKTNKWFIDKRRENIYPADFKWLKAVLYQKDIELNPLSKENPRYMAVIMPVNFYSEYITCEFIDEHSRGDFRFNNLKTTEEAHEWFLQLHSSLDHRLVSCA